MPICDKCGMRFAKGQKVKHNRICPEKKEKNYAEQNSDMAEELFEDIPEAEESTAEKEESMARFSISEHDFLLPPDDHFLKEITEVIRTMSEKDLKPTNCPNCGCADSQLVRGYTGICLEYNSGICGFMYLRKTDDGRYIFE